MSTTQDQNNTPEPRKYEKPVAWLLGKQLMGSLKNTLLYTAFGNKIDPRDWMEAQKFGWEAPKNPDAAEDEVAERTDEFWFDYISDSGDGMRATYSIAYLSAGDLWINSAFNEKLTSSNDGGVTAPPKPDVTFDTDASNTLKLPRGSFLMVGGDTTYHLSDYPTLANRFQTPFKWAIEDRNTGASQKKRPIYAIPGNHDYYDLLDGFRRQFRKPVRPDQENQNAPDLSAQLIIPEFERKQMASYIALELPWDWWLWGLDTELGAIDERQKKFFETVNTKGNIPTGRPKKLIVATCAPTTVFGKYARWDDLKSSKTFSQLGLPWHFWTGNTKQEKMVDEVHDSLLGSLTEAEATIECDRLRELLPNPESNQVEVGEGECRLDLSGDVHFYARYWGPQSNGNNSEIMASDNYASVVSGSGGAFHHPSYTSVGEIVEQVLYPKKMLSLKAVASRIFDPRSIWTGGSVWLLGFLIAFSIYFSSAVAPNTKNVMKGVVCLFNSQSQICKPVIEEPKPVPQPVVGPNGSGVLVELSKSFRNLIRGSERLLGGLALLGTLALIIFAAVKGKEVFRIRGLRIHDDETKSHRMQRIRARQIKLWAFILLNCVLVAFGFYTLSRIQTELYPFESSMLILFSILIGVAALIFCLQYSEWLFEKARREYITKTDWWLVYFVAIGGFVGVAAGLWYFGKKAQYVYVINDIIFALVVLGVSIGLVLLACIKGGEMLIYNRIDKVRIFLVGIWHAILQIAVPFVIVGFGSIKSWLAIIVVSVLASFIGQWSFKNRHHRTLSVVWFTYGLIVLILPFIGTEHDYIRNAVTEPQGAYGSWPGLLTALLAGAVGAVSSCVWFGWYLAICFLNFHGHNNEVGGAARIENFKQFIRFKVTENTITGYVIAVDDVSMIGETVAGKPQGKTGSSLKPRLIDVFTLSVKGTEPVKKAT